MKRWLLFLLAAAPAVARNLTLTWDASPGADYYHVRYGTQHGLQAEFEAPNTPNTSITITNLPENITYFFTATAVKFGSGESDFSNELPWGVTQLRLQRLGNYVMVSWPAAVVGGQLQSSTDLVSWMPVTPQRMGSYWTFSEAALGEKKFYRLK